MPTSRRDATRPSISILPFVGSVIWLRIFKSVLFPAPLRPIIPTTSPWFISKANVLQCPEVFARRKRGSKVGARSSEFSWEPGAEGMLPLPLFVVPTCFNREARERQGAVSLSVMTSQRV